MSFYATYPAGGGGGGGSVNSVSGGTNVTISGTATDPVVNAQNIYTNDGTLTSTRTVLLNGNNLTFDMDSGGRTYIGAHEFRGDVNIVELGRLDANAGANLLVGIDFCSTTGDNNFRILRNGGTNGSANITQTGTGTFTINSVNGPINITSSNEKVQLATWVYINGTNQYRLLTPTTVSNGTTTLVVDVDSLNGQRYDFGASHPGCTLQWQATDARWLAGSTQEYVLFIKNDSSNNITFDSAFFDGATQSLGTGQHVVKCQYDPETNKFFVFQPSAGGGGVNSVSGGTNITVTGTATDPVVNSDFQETQLDYGTEYAEITLTTNLGNDINFYPEKFYKLNLANSSTAHSLGLYRDFVSAPYLQGWKLSDVFLSATTLSARGSTTFEIYENGSSVHAGEWATGVDLCHLETISRAVPACAYYQLRISGLPPVPANGLEVTFRFTNPIS